MPDLLLAPYLVLKSPVSVGPWDLVPFRHLKEEQEESDEDPRVWVPNALHEPVLRLLEAYAVAGGGVSLGAVIVPQGGKAGDPFDPLQMTRLGHALIAGSVAGNPAMALSEDEQSANGGHQVATSENALLFGHPLAGGNSYAIQTGMLVRQLALRTAGDDEQLPKVAPPVELPTPILGNFDYEVAEATHAALSADNVSARRLHRALDWYRIALSNAEAVTLDVRVGATRSAIEALTGLSDKTKKVIRAYGALMRDDATIEQTHVDAFWAKGPVQLTPDEWWLTRLSQLRNAIVHGDAVPDDLWQHEGHHQLNHIHDRLIAMLKRVVADHAGDDLLRLTMGDRLFPRIAQEMASRRREAHDAESEGEQPS